MEEQSVNIFTLSKQDTSFLKGVAICAMLCHHLYGCPIEGVEPYTGIFAWIGNLGKICVAMFLFCSAYGLSAGYNDITTFKDKLRFVRNRLIKFYTNYWVILLLFIPIGVFVLGRTFDVAYAGLNMPKRMVYEIFGINGGCSYIQTWWFNQLIIIMYLIFPLLYKIIKYIPLLTLVFAVLYLLFGDEYTFGIVEFNIWLLPFITGIFWKLYEDKLCSVSKICQSHKIIFALVTLSLFVVVTVIRNVLLYPNSIRMDALLTIGISLCVVSIFRLSPRLMRGVAFLGGHSMNIYLIHSFFNVPLIHNCEWLRGG